jgi:hypothetical protein
MMSKKLMPLSVELVELNKNKYKMRSTVDAIQLAYEEQESGIVIGQCKSLIESFAKSILDEFKVDYATDSSFAKLTKKSVTALSVGAETDNPKKTREAYLKLITSFSTSIESAAQGIGELRNDHCPLAHGRSVYQNQLDMSYAIFIANQTDSLVWFIHELRIRALAPKDKVIENDSDFNERLDDTYDSIEISGDTYLPSEILWNIKPDKYFDLLVEHKEEQEQPID